MRTTLELLRIIIIFALLGTIGWVVLGSIYRFLEVAERYTWLGGIAILLLLFVLYRNKFQFSGWYKGKGRLKLPKPVFLTLVFGSFVMMVMPFVLGKI
ncbi:hypothetical protein [Oceanobacillus sp. CAU 1775]